MLKRVAAHYVGIKTGAEKKYRLLSEIQRKGHPIEFDVLYYARQQGQRQSVKRKEAKRASSFDSTSPY